MFGLQDYLTSDQIYDSFVPICFRYMGDGVQPVKISAALALAVFLRYSIWFTRLEKNLQESFYMRLKLCFKVNYMHFEGKTYCMKLRDNLCLDSDNGLSNLQE